MVLICQGLPTGDFFANGEPMKLMRLRIFVATLSLVVSFDAFSQGPKITYTTTPGKMRIREVEKDSPYDRAGFKSGDVVKEINGKKVDDNSTSTQLNEAVRSGKTVKVERKGKIISLKGKPMETEVETQDVAPPAEDPK